MVITHGRRLVRADRAAKAGSDLARRRERWQDRVLSGMLRPTRANSGDLTPENICSRGPRGTLRFPRFPQRAVGVSQLMLSRDADAPAHDIAHAIRKIFFPAQGGSFRFPRFPQAAQYPGPPGFVTSPVGFETSTSGSGLMGSEPSTATSWYFAILAWSVLSTLFMTRVPY